MTGASRGIGLVCARALLKAGARVLGVGRDAERLSEASLELSKLGEFITLRADVSDRGAAGTMARMVQDRWGALDVLVNNAAIMEWRQDFEAEGPDLLEETLRVNLIGPHRLILAMLPLLRRGNDPRIINVSSEAGMFACLRDEPDGASYRLSKYALNGLTLLYARMLKGAVAVNSLDPGWVRTDMGGPQAPVDPEATSELLVDLLDKPPTETGKFWRGKWEIQF